MNKLYFYVVLVVCGAAIGWVASSLMPQQHSSEMPDSDEPLYWVAPMDANFQRDQPGLSPMGMELVPVYADDKSESAGQVYIAPNVVNNLGVVSETVHRDVLKTTINTVGYVQYDQERLIHIHPRVAGWLHKLHVKTRGERVEKGQPLYDIYSPTLVNVQEELLLGMARKNKRLISAAKERLKSLLVPMRVIEQVTASNKVKQNITIYAPQSGVIDNLSVREGFYLEPGTNIMSVASLEKVWVDAHVFERQSNSVKVGDEVTMTLDYWPGELWHGAVDYIYPTVDAKTRTLRVRLRFDNDQGKLKPNMFAKVRIDSDRGDEQILVSQQAVIRTGHSTRVVMDLGEGNFKSVNVTLGRSNAQSVEVLSGLAPGDKIVTSAQFLIDSESSVDSDFMRLNSAEEPMMSSSAVTVDVVIEAVMAGEHKVTLTHPPIEQWDWPQMTMNFTLSDNLKPSQFKIGSKQQVTLVNDPESGYMVSELIENAATSAHSHHDMTGE